ncbi:hypothetical protein PENSPDRAFT_200117 [Peniophora sp. CONT]|nr:hypothetical protein PENSPDRAFT_200117 [Peniophora sp. CONT]
MFNFTFSFSVPGVSNPFASAPAQEHDRDKKTPVVAPSAPARRPHPATLPPALPLSRKRGWVPSEPEPSEAATIQASSSGYLDTPAKYRDFTLTPHAMLEDEVEEMVADLPPAKRRRTLAGSIVSTAVSAALIGTAVGLTVYRLWRDRGKDGGDSGLPIEPPPPYARGDWPHGDEQHHSARHEANNLPAVNVVPPTPSNKRARRTAAIAGKRTPIRQRRPRPALQPDAVAKPAMFMREPSPTASLARSPVRPEFNLSSIPAELPDAEEDPDESMDWMGDRLAQLIAEGQRALGKEVVVASDAPEDEEDDMSGAWDDEPEPSMSMSATSSPARRSHSTRSRRRRPAQLGIPGAFTGSTTALPSPPMSASSSTSGYAASASMAMSVPAGHGHERARSEGAGLAFSEDPSSWQSEEMRESMQRARERLLASRAR